ncbi:MULTISPECIES: CDP-diacylglycerol--serine O-phosphatidyltransferase [unclassified Rummeliibacillus]|uniref:CDP-diacylglycerol--serine O-phosphatidyltransferase n=1 Tax=unclassified Rummeliibacillus TaxID=2622809 RepID=UPI000E660074|nr:MULTISPECIES: CDP-diacylglycerol--serine O-phosphatidyltransferase [unclassified Rummeliibacillus]RIJ67535.1 CDP-diacylglycerol--serine O-phosphatidyltransferase [Rummeliibacillus sp. POC4]RPJ97095.1 CDP-diacylglycerol--serine O-phosphatidyltransferase [Rummeliibacillus sp. TYF005]
MFLIHKVDTTIKKMKSHIANLITIGNISFGGASIMATIHESYNFAVLFIFIAAFLDRYDGKVARKFNQESELGKQLDSMSDIISFGVAPAILMYEMTLMQFGTIGMIVAVLYIACGAFRLARFNITESNGYFCGLPITAAGAILTVSFFFIPLFSTVFYMFLFPILSILMISTFSLKKV